MLAYIHQTHFRATEKAKIKEKVTSFSKNVFKGLKKENRTKTFKRDITTPQKVAQVGKSPLAMELTRRSQDVKTVSRHLHRLDEGAPDHLRSENSATTQRRGHRKPSLRGDDQQGQKPQTSNSDWRLLMGWEVASSASRRVPQEFRPWEQRLNQDFLQGLPSLLLWQ